MTYLWGMEVHFTPDTQTQLQQLAASEGKDAAQVVEETITRMLRRRSEFVGGDELRRWLDERERS